MAFNIRKEIISSLYEILFNNKLSDIVYDVDIEKDIDKALYTKEIFGVLENKILLEYVIDKYSKVKHKKLDKFIYVILLLGVYEILFLEKIPSFATINTYVDIIKKSKTSRLSGYVNAILRNVDRNENLQEILTSDIDENIKYSIPSVISDYYAKNNICIKEAIKKHIYIRVNSKRTDINEFVINEFDRKKITYIKYNGCLLLKYFMVYEINDVKSILDSESYKKGYIYFEDVASIYFIDKLYDLLITNDINVKCILDTCASPGGKVYGLYHLLDDMRIEGKAHDITKDKIDMLEQNKVRENIDNIEVSIQDACMYNSMYNEKFDVVICDVPCSGLGVISKKPDIKYNYSVDKMRDLIDIQKKILDVSKKYVKKGGILTYSTCTITEDENKENKNWFIDNNKNFELLYEEQIYQSKDNNADGFYMAIFKKI